MLFTDFGQFAIMTSDGIIEMWRIINMIKR